MKVRRSEWKAVPWKNGQGITHELFRLPEEGPFTLRLSAAVVSSDSPFSSFPGIDRTITLLEGHGFELRREDGVTALVAGAMPFSFHGEDRWSCRLLQGPVLDFNVMVDRSVWRATVHVSESTWRTPARNVALLALQDGVRAGDETLGLHDLLVPTESVSLRGRCLVVQWGVGREGERVELV
jgi:environmental stress-induced protein Ves